MSKTVVAGLDIGTSTMRLMVVLPGEEARPPRVLAAAKRDSHGLRRGYLINFEEALRSLKELVREAERATKFPIRSVYLGVGGISLEARAGEGEVTVAHPEGTITHADVVRAVAASEKIFEELPNRRVLHALPVGWKLDGKKILGRPEGLHGRKLGVKTLFIHSLSQHLDDLLRLAREAGLVVEDVVAAPLAAALPTLTTTQKAAGSVLANIGAQTTSVIVYEEGTPISVQIFPVGANDITNDIALGLRVGLDDAERLKQGGEEAEAVRHKLDEIIEARLSDMFELIEAHLKKIGRSGLLPAGIIIVGGGARVEHIEQLAKNYLRLPATVFDPGRISQLKNQISDPGWMVAYGLALWGLEEGHERRPTVEQLGETARGVLRWLKELWP